MSKDVVRLRGHLVEKEDLHNQELLEGANRLEALQKKYAIWHFTEHSCSSCLRLDGYVNRENAMNAALQKYEKLQVRTLMPAICR